MKKFRIFVLLSVTSAGAGLCLPASSAPASPSPHVRGSTQNDLPPCLPPHAHSTDRNFL